VLLIDVLQFLGGENGSLAGIEIHFQAVAIARLQAGHGSGVTVPVARRLDGDAIAYAERRRRRVENRGR
jgi:hypothetical protein